MPYKSKAQAAYMHINMPKIAARWDKEYGGVAPKNYPFGEKHHESMKKKKKGTYSQGVIKKRLDHLKNQDKKK